MQDNSLRLDHRPSEFFNSMPSAEVAVISALLDGERNPKKASTYLSWVEDMCCALHFTEDRDYPTTAADKLIRAFFEVEEYSVYREEERPVLIDYLNNSHDKNMVLLLGDEGGYIYWSASQGAYDSFQNVDDSPVMAVWRLKNLLSEGT